MTFAICIAGIPPALLGPPTSSSMPPTDSTTSSTTTPIELDAQPATHQEEIPNGLRTTYAMDRTIKTVTDLWEEWDNGYKGGPAIRELEERVPKINWHGA